MQGTAIGLLLISLFMCSTHQLLVKAGLLAAIIIIINITFATVIYDHRLLCCERRLTRKKPITIFLSCLFFDIQLLRIILLVFNYY